MYDVNIEHDVTDTGAENEVLSSRYLSLWNDVSIKDTVQFHLIPVRRRLPRSSWKPHTVGRTVKEDIKPTCKAVDCAWSGACDLKSCGWRNVSWTQGTPPGNSHKLYISCMCLRSWTHLKLKWYGYAVKALFFDREEIKHLGGTRTCQNTWVKCVNNYLLRHQVVNS